MIEFSVLEKVAIIIVLSITTISYLSLFFKGVKLPKKREKTNIKESDKEEVNIEENNNDTTKI